MYTLSSNRDDNPQAQVTNQANYNLDWGPAGIDRRHALVASGSVDLPWKFQLGAIWQIRSSLPFSAFSTVQVDGVTQYVPGLTRDLGNRNNTELLAMVNAYRASLATPLAPIPISQINSSRFNSFDIVISRPIWVREHKRVELKGQAFNLFGTTNLMGGTTTTATSANFGRILNASNTCSRRNWRSGSRFRNRRQRYWNRSSISTRYPLESRLVSLAIPTTAINSANMASLMPALRAEAVWDAMQ